MNYNDNFTFDGRLKPGLGVTKTKVEAANRLLGDALRGSAIAEGTFKEALTTSDLQFNVAYLVSQELVPQFDEAERTWSQIAGVRTVPTFDNIRLFSLFGDVTGAGIRSTGGAVRVPEAAPYPHVTLAGQEAVAAGVHKNGFRFAFTWESNINDVAGFFAGLPQELLSVAVDTEESEVYDALIEGTDQTDRALQGGTLPDGTVVPGDAPVSPSAIWQAIRELAEQEVNGRKIGRASGYNVIVPVGTKDFLDFALSQRVLQVVDGNLILSAGERDTLGSVTVIESDRLTGTEWYFLPKPGAIRRPVLELARLRGYETPELRVQNATGQYVGGGAVSPFEGSFDNDTIDYRFRYVAGGILWTDELVIYSDGTGTNP